MAMDISLRHLLSIKRKTQKTKYYKYANRRTHIRFCKLYSFTFLLIFTA